MELKILLLSQNADNKDALFGRFVENCMGFVIISF